MSDSTQKSMIVEFYYEYLDNQNTPNFIKNVNQHYTIGTIERLSTFDDIDARRAAVLSLGMIGRFTSNLALGRRLNDDDRAVRMIAENSLKQIWKRAGNEQQDQKILAVVQLNTNQQFEEAIEKVSDLIEEAPWYAEAWNQRAIARYATDEFVLAIQDCRQALEINPYHFGASSGMGQCYLSLGAQYSALECFKQAIELNPNMESVRVGIAQLERTLKNN